VQESKDKLEAWLQVEPFKAFARKKLYQVDYDRITINYNSYQQKALILRRIVPELPGGTKNIINKYIRDNAKTISEEDLLVLVDVRDGNYKTLEAKLLKDHRNWLIEQGFLIPAGMSTINWNSPDQ